MMFVSDLQWSERPPVFRAVEKDWLEVQGRYIDQLKELQRERGMVPIVMVGDLFDHHNPSHRLVNFLIARLRGMLVFAIPGNHDLLHHNYREIDKTGYWTLVEAGAIRHLESYIGPDGEPVGHAVGPVMLYPYPYGFPVQPCPKRPANIMQSVAVIHSYVWGSESTRMPGATEETRIGSWAKKLKGYDAAIFGDNHRPFFCQKVKDKVPAIASCGTFLRRHSDEKEIRPRVTLLHTDDRISVHYLNTHNDLFFDAGEEVSRLEKNLEIDLGDFAEELGRLYADKLDFAKIVLRWLEKAKPPDAVRILLKKAIGVKSHANRSSGRDPQA